MIIDFYGILNSVIAKVEVNTGSCIRSITSDISSSFENHHLVVGPNHHLVVGP